MGTHANASSAIVETARHCITAVRAWLAQRPESDPQRLKTQHDHALCAVILELLAQPAAMATDTEWLCQVHQPLGDAPDDGEWYSYTRTLEVFVRANGITLNEYMNYATIIGATQSPIRCIRSAAPAADDAQQLHDFRSDLETALQSRSVFVDAGKRAIAP